MIKYLSTGIKYTFILSGILWAKAPNVWAQTDYNFNSAAPIKSDPVRAKEDKHESNPNQPFIVFDYPKGDLGISLNPGLYSLSQSLISTGSKFNFSNFNYADFTLSGFALLTPRVIGRVSLNYHQVSVADSDLQTFQIVNSSASALSATVAGGYCFYGSDYEQKICPGIELGADTYPILDFDSNTTLSLKKLNDVSVGPNLTFLSTLGAKFSLRFLGSYRVGLKQGQSAGYRMLSDHTLQFGGEAFYPVGKNAKLSFGLGVRGQGASFQHNADLWEMSNTSYIMNLGYRIEWGAER